MFIRSSKPTAYEQYIHEWFALNRTAILDLHRKMWLQEDLYDKSCLGNVIMQYYLCLYLVLLIKYEINEGIQTTWSYYIDKYKLNDLSKEFACNNISLKKALKIFGLNTETEVVTPSDEIGIEHDAVGVDFIIEPDSNPRPQVNIIELLEMGDNCINNVSGIGTLPIISTPSIPILPGGLQYMNIYIGNSPLSVLDETAITNLRSISQLTRVGAYNYRAGDYKYLAIPVAFGSVLTFTDPSTGFPVAMNAPYVISIGNDSYNIYRTYYSLGGVLTIIVT